MKFQPILSAQAQKIRIFEKKLSLGVRSPWYYELRHKLRKPEMFGPNVADKYAWNVTKYLGLGCNSQPCSADHFLIIHRRHAHCWKLQN